MPSFKSDLEGNVSKCKKKKKIKKHLHYITVTRCLYFLDGRSKQENKNDENISTIPHPLSHNRYETMVKKLKYLNLHLVQEKNDPWQGNWSVHFREKRIEQFLTK